jgi:DGQHR domain-containing protein
MPDNQWIEFSCLEVKQPIGTFYMGVMNFNDVINISYADVRRIEQREVEVVLGIQRPLADDRVKELQHYVRTVDASFPTSIILAVSELDEEGEPNVVFDEEFGTMRIKKRINLARIIDGQHRIAGLVNYEGPPFQLNVTLFVDMDVEDQALLFATINLKQTKVNKSLAYDLFEFSMSRSPQKTCHNIAKILNSQERSPLHGRIKILGKATGKPHENLTQAAVVERLIVYISPAPMRDRDLIKRGRRLAKATPQDEELRNLIFRNMFIDEHDENILLILWNYFTAVARKWPAAWNSDTTGYILNRTTGFAALMRLLPSVYRAIAQPGEIPDEAAFARVLNRSELRDAAFTRETYIPGSSGERRLLEDLTEDVL